MRESKVSIESPSIEVVAYANPFTHDRSNLTVCQGLTLAEIYEMAQPDPILRGRAHIQVEGHAIYAELWHRVRPKAGQRVEIVAAIPSGGEGGGQEDDNKALRLFIIVAIAIVSAGAGAGVAGAAAEAGFTAAGAAAVGTATSAAISIGGTLAVNALLPPSEPELDDDTFGEAASLRGGTNRVRRYGPIPQILGRHRMIPPLASRAFRTREGINTFLILHLAWNKGKMTSPEDLKIGDTLIENLQEVEVRHRIDPSDPPLPFITETVIDVPYNIELTQAAGYRIRTTEPNVDEIVVEILIPRLVDVDDSGINTPQTIEFEAQIALTGTSDWSSGTPGNELFLNSRSVVLPTVPNGQIKERGQTVTEFTREQGTRIGMNPFTGELITAQSNIRNADPVGGGTSRFVPDGPIVFPEWPGGSVTAGIRIAEVVVQGSDIVSLTDARDPNDDRFKTPATDFAPTDGGGTTVNIAAGDLTFRGFRITGKANGPTRDSIRFQVDRGTYDVRVRKLTSDSTGGRINDAFWVTLASIRHELPVLEPNLNETVIKVRETGQLTGILEQVSAIVQSVVPDWNGAAWVERKTRNPASLARYVMTGGATRNPVAISSLDDPAWEDWHEFNVARGFTFDLPVDFRTSVDRLLRQIFFAGRALLSNVDGKWTVVIDEPRAAVATINPMASWAFEFTRPLIKLPDGVRARFKNQDADFADDERFVADDGFTEATAVDVEVREYPGVVDADLVFTHARYEIAQARLRPEIYKFFVGVLGLSWTRGDHVLINHDVLSVGTGFGRISEAFFDSNGDVEALRLNSKVTMTTGDHAIVIETPSNVAITSLVELVAGESDQVQLVTPIPAAIAPGRGDLFHFGPSGRETVDVVVTEIEPSEQLVWAITCVPYSEAIFDAEKAPIPPFDPVITPTTALPPPPIASVESDETALLRDTDGSFKIRIVAEHVRPPGLSPDVDFIEGRIREVGSTLPFVNLGPFPVDDPLFSFFNVQAGESYEFQLRYIESSTPAKGPYSALRTHTVIGKTGLPPAIKNLRCERVAGQDVLRWDLASAEPADFLGYEVLTRPGVLFDASGMTSLTPAFPSVTQYELGRVPFGTRTYAVRSVDTSGNKSAASFLAKGAVAPLVSNVVLSEKETDRGWPGTLTGGTLVSDELRADGDATLYLPQGDALYLPDNDMLYLPVHYQEMVYTTDILPNGAAVGARLIIDVTEIAEGLEIEYDDGGSEPYLPNDGTFGRTDDLYLPNGADLYLPLVNEFKAFSFEIDALRVNYQFRFTVKAGNVQSKIQEIEFIYDVDDLLEVATFTVPLAGGRVPITKNFRQITGLSWSIDGSSGNAFVLKHFDLDPANGPFVQLFDQAGAATTGNIVATVQGF